MTLPAELAWQRLEGRTDPPAGWYSPSFGVRVPAVTLVGSGRVGPGQILTTALQLDRRDHAVRISVFGLGYVGAVSAACLAADGHTVVGVDTNPVKVDLLNQGHAPVVEAGLGELIEEGVRAGRLRATTDCDAAVAGTDIGLVCVGTPSKGNGSLDLTNLRRVAGDIGQAIRRCRSPITVVVRSTVLPGTTREVVQPELERTAGGPVAVAVYPEFLREGTAIRDYREPPKVVVGAIDEAVRDVVTVLAARPRAPLLQTDLELAEMAKYVDNSWHALKVTFANEIGSLAKGPGSRRPACHGHPLRRHQAEPLPGLPAPRLRLRWLLPAEGRPGPALPGPRPRPRPPAPRTRSCPATPSSSIGRSSW